MGEIVIGDRTIGLNHPTYFIAEIGSNHDGSLERAKKLVRLAAEAGAEAAKFQNFTARKIASDYGFRKMDGKVSHQAQWQGSVYDIYDGAATPAEWTPLLRDACDEAGVHYISSPYDFDSADALDPYVPAFKIGSGDIDWIEALEHVARKGKPVMLGCGAADSGEVDGAVRAVSAINPQLVLMQCNTNYTGSRDNFAHINLNVLKTFAIMFPEALLGLSDHTPGHTACLGAVTLGARVIEKHFTDDPLREGMDHHFAMSPAAFKDMVNRTRELEAALGRATKRIAPNERETIVVQRRCVRAARDIENGEAIARDMLDVLRPVEAGAVSPADVQRIMGTTATVNIEAGDAIRWTDLSS